MIIPAARICFRDEDRREVLEKIDGVLKSGQLTLGKYTREFEDRFARFTGTKYAVAVSSGTSALEIILRALNIENSSVIVPTNTFFATPASVIHANAKVIFADVSNDLCLDPEAVEKCIQKDTKAVIVVHIGGLVSPNVSVLQSICTANNLHFIEDAAHAHGSTLCGKNAGTFGIAAAFSFYPTKVMTSAEGGMITTDDENVYKRALVLRDQGKSGFQSNIHTEMGYNWRMSEVHAIIGISQLARLEEFILARQKIAKIYDKCLAKISVLSALKIPPEAKSNYYKYVAFLQKGTDRVALKKALRENHGVNLSGEVYELPCHLQPIFNNMRGLVGGGFAGAEDFCMRHICLPVFVEMKENEAKYVVESLKGVLG